MHPRLPIQHLTATIEWLGTAREVDYLTVKWALASLGLWCAGVLNFFN